MPARNITIAVPQPYNKIGDGPEGPEVYRMSQTFSKKFLNATLQELKPLHKRYHAIPQDFLEALPLKVASVTSKGKKTVIRFNKDKSLLVSYGMTGHWRNTQEKHAQLHFIFNVGDYFWVSARNLTTCVIEFLSCEELDKKLAKLGWDIIRDHPDDDQILQAYTASKGNICAFLMSQEKFCGIGNYVKAVVLYRCKISPWTRVQDLNDEQKWWLWHTAKVVAKEALDGNLDMTPYSCGEDSYGNKVIHEKIASRTTWWVPNVQK